VAFWYVMPLFFLLLIQRSRVKELIHQTGQNLVNRLLPRIWEYYMLGGYYRMIQLFHVRLSSSISNPFNDFVMSRPRWSHTHNTMPIPGLENECEGQFADEPANNLPISTTSQNPTVIHISVRSFSIRAEDGKLYSDYWVMYGCVAFETGREPKVEGWKGWGQSSVVADDQIQRKVQIYTHQERDRGVTKKLGDVNVWSCERASWALKWETGDRMERNRAGWFTLLARQPINQTLNQYHSVIIVTNQTLSLSLSSTSTRLATMPLAWLAHSSRSAFSSSLSVLRFRLHSRSVLFRFYHGCIRPLLTRSALEEEKGIPAWYDVYLESLVYPSSQSN
jgi:hypothetical protein